MSVVVIPFAFESGRCRRGVVPICVPEEDSEGQRIAWRWFEAVVPVADYLSGLARERLFDVWRVSELAEVSVHAQWRNHGEDFGKHPHLRIAAYARWAAEDLRCGGSRLRKRLDILLGGRDRSLVDPIDHQLRFDTAHCVHQLRSAVQKMASEEAAHILDMVLSGFKWEGNRKCGRNGQQRAYSVGSAPTAFASDQPSVVLLGSPV